jgi:predicted permease
MRQSPRSKGFIARHPLPFFVALPVVTLAIIVIVSAAAEIVLDHYVLSRATNGMPLLYSLPWARNLVAWWNLALIYLAPVLMALAVWKVGKAREVHSTWLMVGGALICVVGGIQLIEAVWTGIKGTSGLRIGPVCSLTTAAIRIAANLAVFGGIVFLSQRRREVA